MWQIAIDFLAGTDLSSWFIEKFGVGHGGYSHCASLLKDGRYLDARWDTIAGVAPGVHIRLPETEKWIRKRRATLSVDEATYTDWEANLRAKITDDYGVGDILDFLDGSESHVAGRWICSALAINAVQHVGRHWTAPHLGLVPYPLHIAAHAVSPNMCLAYLEGAGFTIGPEITAP